MSDGKRKRKSTDPVAVAVARRKMQRLADIRREAGMPEIPALDETPRLPMYELKTACLEQPDSVSAEIGRLGLSPLFSPIADVARTVQCCNVVCEVMLLGPPKHIEKAWPILQSLSSTTAWKRRNFRNAGASTTCSRDKFSVTGRSSMAASLAEAYAILSWLNRELAREYGDAPGTQYLKLRHPRVNNSVWYCVGSCIDSLRLFRDQAQVLNEAESFPARSFQILRDYDKRFGTVTTFPSSDAHNTAGIQDEWALISTLRVFEDFVSDYIIPDMPPCTTLKAFDTFPPHLKATMAKYVLPGKSS